MRRDREARSNDNQSSQPLENNTTSRQTQFSREASSSSQSQDLQVTLPQMSEKIRENNQLENKSEPFSDISLSDDQGKDAEQTLKALKIELSIMPKIRNIEQEIDKSQKQLECLDLLKDEPTILNKTRKNLTNFREDLKKLNNTYTGLHLKPKDSRDLIVDNKTVWEKNIDDLQKKAILLQKLQEIQQKRQNYLQELHNKNEILPLYPLQEIHADSQYTYQNVQMYNDATQELHETQPLLEHSILVPEEHAHLQHVREPLQKNKSNTLQKLDDTQSKLISPDLLQAKREILSRSRWQLEKLYHDFNASSDRIHTYCLLTRNDKVRIPMSLWYWYRCSFTREGQWERRFAEADEAALRANFSWEGVQSGKKPLVKPILPLL